MDVELRPRDHVRPSENCTAADRQEDRLQAVPVGPQGVDRADADVHRRHAALSPVSSH